MTSSAYDTHVQQKPKEEIRVDWSSGLLCKATVWVAKDPPHARLLHMHNAWTEPTQAAPRQASSVPQLNRHNMTLDELVAQCVALGMPVPDPTVLYAPSTCFDTVAKPCKAFRQHVV